VEPAAVRRCRRKRGPHGVSASFRVSGESRSALSAQALPACRSSASRSSGPLRAAEIPPPHRFGGTLSTRSRFRANSFEPAAPLLDFRAPSGHSPRAPPPSACVEPRLSRVEGALAARQPSWAFFALRRMRPRGSMMAGVATSRRCPSLAFLRLQRADDLSVHPSWPPGYGALAVARAGPKTDPGNALELPSSGLRSSRRSETRLRVLPPLPL